MKKNWKFIEMNFLFAALLLVFSACGNNKNEHQQHGAATSWQCPMKCEGEKTYAEAGACPVCKMDLKAVENHSEHKSEGSK
ncbi:MAG: hypothetical protein J0L99_07475 [Chitinophagales bacterium]|nr:hypothetical protein [Chitinophagales bacterium]